MDHQSEDGEGCLKGTVRGWRKQRWESVEMEDLNVPSRLYDMVPAIITLVKVDIQGG